MLVSRALFLGRQVEGVVGALFGAFSQLDAALRPGLRGWLKQLGGRRRDLAAIGGDRHGLARLGLQVRAHTAGGKRSQQGKGHDKPHRVLLQPQRLARLGNALPYLVRRGSAMAGARGYRSLNGKRRIDPLAHARIDRLQIRQRQLVERDAAAFGQLHRAARDVVGFAERDVRLADQPVGKVGGGGIAEFGGIAHTHSTYATAWAQAQRDIPIYGTTHADHNTVDIPCAPPMSDDMIKGDYEFETGLQIINCLKERNLYYNEVEMVLVGNHAPFTWGKTAAKAVYNSAVLEQVAQMALLTEQINPAAPRLKDALISKHYTRKHGPGSYYGQ